MVPGDENSEIENLFALLHEKNFTKFFELLPHTLEICGGSPLREKTGKRLVSEFFTYNQGENRQSNQQLFIKALFRGIPNFADRLSLYEEAMNICRRISPECKDDFIVDLILIEQSRDIVRFAYTYAEPYGKAHYLSIFYFLTRILLQVHDIVGEPKYSLKRPRIRFSEKGTVRFVIPTQCFTKEARDRRIMCLLFTGSGESCEINLEKYDQGEKIHTAEYEDDLPRSKSMVRLSLMLDGTIIRMWDMPGISGDRPFLAFRDSSRTFIEKPELPRERTWLISPFPLIHEEGLLEKGRPDGQWNDCWYYLINPLPSRDYYLQITPGSLFRIPFISADRKPTLLGTRVEGVIIDSPVPWYSDIPRLVIPRSNEDGEEQVEVEIIQGNNPAGEIPVKVIRVPGLADYIHEDERLGAFVVDLSHEDLLGPSPVGDYGIRFPGSGTSLKFCIAPGLRILFHPPLFSLPVAGEKSVEVEIEGPPGITPLTPCTKIRDGLFRLGAHGNPLPSGEVIGFCLLYNGTRGTQPVSLPLRIGLPLIHISLAGVPESVTISHGGRLCVLKEDLIASLETAAILIEKPAELTGEWVLSVGTQESRLHTTDERGNLTFPLLPFREFLLGHYSEPIPVTLVYTAGGIPSRIHLISLLDWDVEYTGETVNFRDGLYYISVSWKERGRSRVAAVAITREDGESSPGFSYVDTHVDPPGFDWRDHSVTFTIPLAESDGVYIFGFLSGGAIDDEWAPSPAFFFPRKFRPGGDPFVVAEFYYSQRAYDKCIEWLTRVPQDDPKFPDALVLHAQCLIHFAGKSSSWAEKKELFEEAIGLVKKALSLKDHDPGLLVTLAQLHNRAGLLPGGEDHTQFHESAGILAGIIGKNPWDFPAIAEYGIALAGLGRIHEAMKIFQFIEFLDPDTTRPESAYAKAVLLSEYGTKVRGKSGEDFKNRIDEFSKKAREYYENNPLYDFIRDAGMETAKNGSVNARHATGQRGDV